MRIVTEPHCTWDLGCELGEGAVFSQRDGSVWFVDIKAQKIHRHGPDGRRSWDAPQKVSFVLPSADGRWIAGLQSGLHLFDPVTGQFTALKSPEDHGPDERLNDGHVDQQGRLWFGTMADSETGRAGKLYRLTATGDSQIQDRPYGITNGPATSPDGRTLYHTDTAERVIYAFDLSEDGSLSGKREFVRIARRGAHPDGPCVDSEGCVWTALFGGWGLERYSPKGELLDYVALPTPNVTKVAFGGADLTTLYVTTARHWMNEAQLATSPLAGGLFELQVDVPGLAQNHIVHGL